MNASYARWLVLAMAACGPSTAPTPASPAPPAPPVDAAAPLPLDRDLPLLAQRATRLYQDIAQAFAAVGEDCAAATARLAELRQLHADVVAANAKVVHEGRTGALRAALAPHAETLDAAARDIVGSPTLARCAQDVAFTEAYDRLVGAPP